MKPETIVEELIDKHNDLELLHSVLEALTKALRRLSFYKIVKDTKEDV